MSDVETIKRDVWQAMKRGFVGKCPNCGKGALFSGYLKQQPCCSSCRERTGAIRADDGPAWATILLVGHIVSPVFFIFANRDPGAALLPFLIIAALVVTLSLILLPRMKGLFIGLIWASHAGEAVSAEP